MVFKSRNYYWVGDTHLLLCSLHVFPCWKKDTTVNHSPPNTHTHTHTISQPQNSHEMWSSFPSASKWLLQFLEILLWRRHDSYPLPVLSQPSKKDLAYVDTLSCPWLVSYFPTSLSLYVADERNIELVYIPVSIVNITGLYPPTQMPLKLLLNYMYVLPEHTIAQMSCLETTWWLATDINYPPPPKNESTTFLF